MIFEFAIYTLKTSKHFVIKTLKNRIANIVPSKAYANTHPPPPQRGFWNQWTDFDEIWYYHPWVIEWATSKTFEHFPFPTSPHPPKRVLGTSGTISMK